MKLQFRVLQIALRFSRARKLRSLLALRSTLCHLVQHLIQMRRELQHVQVYALN